MPSPKPSSKQGFGKKKMSTLTEPKLNAVSKIEDVEEFLSQDMGDDTSERKIAKELFSNEDVLTKTDLSDNQINILTRLYFLAEEMEDKDLSSVIDKFVTLRISRKRKSRGEFIEALKGINDSQSGAGMLGNMGKMFGGGR